MMESSLFSAHPSCSPLTWTSPNDGLLNLLTSDTLMLLHELVTTDQENIFSISVQPLKDPQEIESALVLQSSLMSKWTFSLTKPTSSSLMFLRLLTDDSCSISPQSSTSSPVHLKHAIDPSESLYTRHESDVYLKSEEKKVLILNKRVLSHCTLLTCFTLNS